MSERLPLSKSFVTRLRERVTSLYAAVTGAPSLAPSAGDSDATLWDKFLGLVSELSLRGSSSAVSVATIAALRALDVSNLANGTVITVAGYYTAGDGGGGEFRIDTADAATADDGGSVIATGSGARAKAIFSDSKINIRRYGAKGDNSTNDGPAIQAAIDFAVANRVADVFVPEGTFVTAQTIQHKAPCNLIGTGTVYTARDSRVVGDSAYGAAGKSCIKLANGANVPLINVNTEGRANQVTGSTTDDGVVVNKGIHGGIIDGILLDGNGSNQTRFDCDLIRALYIWQYTIHNVAFMRPSGYMVWARECNVLQVVKCNGTGDLWDRSKGVLYWSAADSKVLDSDFGGVTGPVIQISGAGGWQNLVSGNLAFNSITYRRTVTGVASNTVTFSASHCYETGSPIQFVADAGGTVPPELTVGRPYWAIRVSATQVRVAASYEAALAGTALTISAGSGTYYGWHGYSSGLDLTWVASKNTVNNNRFDQHQQNGVSLYSANENVIVGNLCNFNQYNTQTNSASVESAAGIALLGYCSRNVIGYNEVSFRAPTYPQDYGVREIGISNADNLIGPHSSQGNTVAKYQRTSATTAFATWSEIATAALVGTGPFGSATAYNIAISGTQIGAWSSTGLAVTGDVASTTLNVGGTALGTVATFTGGAAGVPLFRMVRSGQPTIGFRNSGGLLMFDETNAVPLYKVIWNGSSPVFRLSSDSGAAPALHVFAGHQASGTDVAGGALVIQPGGGTGSGSVAGATVAIQTPNAGSSGSTAQTQSTRMVWGSFGVNIGPSADGTNFRRLKHGTVTLVGGTATVSDATITASTRILLTSQSDGGTPGWLRVSSRSAGVNFVISSSSGTDTSTVAYVLIEP